MTQRDSIINAAEECSRVIKLSIEQNAAAIEDAARMIVDSLLGGGKILVCGNGGSAADSQHFAAELVGRFLANRAPYAAISLTTDTSILTAVANDFGFDSVFERQVAALGRAGDVLVGISTSGNSPNVLRALDAAAVEGMKTISITGEGGGAMAAKSDILIAAASKETPRIQEAHSLIVHLLCGLVESALCVQA